MAVHLHDYDSHYHPAMPVIEIVLHRRAGEPGITIKAIDHFALPDPSYNQCRRRKYQTNQAVIRILKPMRP